MRHGLQARRGARWALAALLLAWGSRAGAAGDAVEEIVTGGGAAGKTIVVDVVAGPNWVGKGGLGTSKIAVTPQVAVWTEDAAGRLLETLFVTRKFAAQRWYGAWPDFKEDQTFRTGALPLWLSRLAARGLPWPTAKAPLADAVTGATPYGDFRVRARSSGAGEIFVLLEVNNAFDQTADWPEHTADAGAQYVGQPAVIWKGKVDLSRPGVYPLSLVGHASAGAPDGQIHPALVSLPTAVTIVSAARVRVE